MKNLEFIHLHVKSSYSLGESSLSIDKIIELAKKNLMPAIALSDNQNLFAALEFSLSAVKNGIQPIISVIFKITFDEKNQETDEILLICKNKTGFKNLLKLSSQSYLNENQNYIKFSELKKHTDGLIALVGGRNSNIYNNFLNGIDDKPLETIKSYQNLFSDHIYIEILRLNTKNEVLVENHLLKSAIDFNIPIVATNNVSFADTSQYEAFDIFGCITNNRTITDKNRIKQPESIYFKSSKEMIELFRDLPEAIANTVTIAKRCSFFPKEAEPMLPDFECQDNRTAEEEIKLQSYEGLKQRLSIGFYPNKTEEELKKYYERLDYELSIINKMGFPGYFLIVSDFIKWSKENDIAVGPGRGSGAGSIVAWALSITELDPLHFGLLFERFLNPQRVSMPDFDIDFCQEKREQVINYVKTKYGDDKVANIITFGKLQAKAVLKDVGRVLMMPYKQVDDICKMIPFNPVNPVTLDQAITLDKDLRHARDSDPAIKKLINISLQLEGLNRHVSTHAAGIVISQNKLINHIALYKDPRSEMPIVQYSMKYAEKAGLVKFDFLGLKTLTTIAKTIEILSEQEILIDIEKINLSDKLTFDLLSSGNSVGVFQLESPGMRDCLKKLKPDSIEDIIALISLYRPGPMDNIPSYIARKHGKEEVLYPHKLLKECLKETFGVIIYQEQVMQIAQILSGYSLGDADLLRRAMGKKIKAEMDAQCDKFVEGAEKNNISNKKAKEIFELVAKFAGYGFNKSHAAAYAMIGYQTAYLKANYPVEFLIATLNLDIHDTDKINYFILEVKRLDIQLKAPSINSSWPLFKLCEIDNKKSINYALSAIKGVGYSATSEIVAIREEQGEFEDIYDFIEKTAIILNKKILENLINAGALDELGLDRMKLIKNLDKLKSKKQSGSSSFYRRRTKKDSEINIKKSIVSQFNLFRSVDNINFPAFFKYKGYNYILKIYKKKFNFYIKIIICLLFVLMYAKC